MFFLSIIFFSLAFALLAWRHLSLAIALLFFLLPTYLIRFSVGPIPITLLEIMILIILGIAIVQKETRDKIQTNLKKQWYKNKLLFIGIFLFLLGATISIVTAVDMQSALGEWKAFYIEPTLLFLVLVGLDLNKRDVRLILSALILSALATALFAVYQHFTGFLVPHDFWANRDTFRVTAWYGFPNAVGLFLAPIVPLALYLGMCYWKKLQVTGYRLQVTAGFVSCILYLVLASSAIIYAKSTGALIGLAAGIGLLLLFYKQTRWPAIVIGVTSALALFFLPQLSGIKQEVLFEDRSGQIRLSMWSEAVELLKDHPILGAGLASYDERIVPYHTTVNGEGIEIFHHPHNIFLTMWVNLGIVGLIGFLCILVWFFTKSFQFPVSSFQFFLASAMIVTLVMGLVDSPYIKNDLALLFWLLPALLALQSKPIIVPKTKV